jgi:hypothetical protein
MKDLSDWLQQRSSVKHRVVFSNCQDFGDDLCTFLMGIGVLHTNATLGFVDVVGAVALARPSKIVKHVHDH